MLTAPYDHFNNTKRHMKRNSNMDHSDNTIAMIDYTNLYIKNLDPQVTSYDLFERFKIFGKIISARVMKDTVTSISKGYGFVSFTHMEEAQEAMQQMNGALFNTKNIVVTFHTHKKPMKHIKTRSLSTDYINLSPPVSTAFYYPSQPSPPYTNNSTTMNSYVPPFMNEPPKPISSTSSTYPTHNPWNENSVPWMHGKSPIVTPHYPVHVPTCSQTTTPTSSNNTLLNDPIDYPTNQLQLQKLREAVSSQLQEHQQKDLNDIVDMIQSLKKRDLSVCLFNPAVMKQKIDEAYDVLYLFQNGDHPCTYPTIDEPLSISTTDYNSATAILNSLEGLTKNKKKRVFGDILYPHVRATGIKHAPKVTICLLDTVPIEELAFSLYDKQGLTKKAQLAYTQLYKK